MNKDTKCSIITEIHSKMLKFNLPYKFPFERGKTNGFDYCGFFISIPKERWLLLCWSDESQNFFNKSFWLEFSSNAANKWSDRGNTPYVCDGKEYCVENHPNTPKRLVIPLDIKRNNMINVINLIKSVSKEVL
ncbi:hypothetical protein ES708_32252 [subsurface metagenome]